MFAAELDNRPVALSVTSGFGISFFYLLAYSWLDGKTVAAPAADTTPVVETIPITETIANGEKTAEIGGKVLETLGDFFGVILIILRFLLPFLLIVGIVTFVIYLFLRMYKEHFAMIKKSRMRIWSFQCCSCMHKFTIITRASDNLSERVPNLVKKPRRKTSTSLYRY